MTISRTSIRSMGLRPAPGRIGQVSASAGCSLLPHQLGTIARLDQHTPVVGGDMLVVMYLVVESGCW